VAKDHEQNEKQTYLEVR